MVYPYLSNILPGFDSFRLSPCHDTIIESTCSSKALQGSNWQRKLVLSASDVCLPRLAKTPGKHVDGWWMCQDYTLKLWDIEKQWCEDRSLWKIFGWISDVRFDVLSKVRGWIGNPTLYDHFIWAVLWYCLGLYLYGLLNRIPSNLYKTRNISHCNTSFGWNEGDILRTRWSNHHVVLKLFVLAGGLLWMWTIDMEKQRAWKLHFLPHFASLIFNLEIFKKT